MTPVHSLTHSGVWNGNPSNFGKYNIKKNDTTRYPYFILTGYHPRVICKHLMIHYLFFPSDPDLTLSGSYGSTHKILIKSPVPSWWVSTWWFLVLSTPLEKKLDYYSKRWLRRQESVHYSSTEGRNKDEIPIVDRVKRFWYPQTSCTVKSRFCSFQDPLDPTRPAGWDGGIE